MEALILEELTTITQATGRIKGLVNYLDHHFQPRPGSIIAEALKEIADSADFIFQKRHS